MQPRECAICGQRFAPGSWNAKYCREHRSAAPPPGRYGWPHERRRASWAPRVAAGTVTCSRCGRLIGPNEPWDLDHSDDGSGDYLGPSHARCNRATSTHRRRARLRRTERLWTTSSDETPRKESRW
jgi:hypothetical protein